MSKTTNVCRASCVLTNILMCLESNIQLFQTELICSLYDSLFWDNGSIIDRLPYSMPAASLFPWFSVTGGSDTCWCRLTDWAQFAVLPKKSWDENLILELYNHIQLVLSFVQEKEEQKKKENRRKKWPAHKKESGVSTMPGSREADTTGERKIVKNKHGQARA